MLPVAHLVRKGEISRDQVLNRIEVHIGKVQKELDSAKASGDSRNRCLYPLQTLKKQVETQESIAHINQALQDAIDAADEAFDKIEAASKAIPKPKPVSPVTPPGGTTPKGGGGDGEGDNKGTGEPEPPVYVKKRTIVKAAQLAPEGLSESQADIDAY